MDNNILAQISEEVIRKTMDCPVCLEIALPPLILCKEGHFVCTTCRDRMEICGICRGEFTTARNYAVEFMVSQVSVRCKYSKCPEIEKLGMLNEHMKICEYRPIACHYSNYCVEPNDWGNFINHLKMHHRVRELRMTGKGKSASVNIPFPTSYMSKDPHELMRTAAVVWESFIMEHKGFYFILNAVSEYTDLFIWISALENHSAFTAKICISDSNGEPRVTHFLDISSIHKELDDVRYTKYCITIPLRCVLKWTIEDENEEDIMPLHVFISNRKPSYNN